MNSLEAQRREAAPPPAAQEPTVPAGAFRFRLEAVTHTPSAILSDEEFTRVTAPFVGRDVAIADLKAMLEAVNALYREKGYVVCEARLAPQRIRGGRLLVTLVEGRTGCTTVSGAEHTSAGYILGAFELKQGEVANYREMSDALVRFNMTNDVELSVDIRAGEAPGTTDYEIRTTEPPNWSASFFADTLGPRSTGRPRAGVSITNRSVFGRRCGDAPRPRKRREPKLLRELRDAAQFDGHAPHGERLNRQRGRDCGAFRRGRRRRGL